MFKESRFHGRGGQGAVTAAYVLAVGAFADGKYSQAFPKFGVERRGAPVESYCRISDSFIRRKSQVYEPNILVVLDSTLFEAVNVTGGLAEGGLIIANTNKDPKDLGLEKFEVKTIDATTAAFELLGRDIVNTAMLGAFAGFTGEVSKDGIHEGLKEQFSGGILEKNIKLVDQIYEEAKSKSG